ncbi:disease susceptibility protein LOV1-like [Salvia miltiorrhiza]|uniref:disease susceptibility protein LOV1-like n=1 Tax=Salvia miltiorrhiza TaxID=226208 RepID=UPI0025ACD565|nr:disease susceptibility protein LOV1-like [Salvia miltiorrhiza]XP_057785361.1 disease susceptibility protein LOV1-like [Salvia miltiorrhiza]
MSEALLLSLIQKLDTNYRRHEPNDEKVIKEMREIVDIVRDKKLVEGRILNFLVCDLVDVDDDALYLFKQDVTYPWNFDSVHSWMGEVKKRMLKLGYDGAETESNMRSSQKVEDDVDVVGLDEDVEMLLRKRIFGEGEHRPPVLIKGMGGSGKTTLAREIYNHPTVVERFELRLWVSNSIDLTMKELLIKLVQQVVPENLHIYIFLIGEYGQPKPPRYASPTPARKEISYSSRRHAQTNALEVFR